MRVLTSLQFALVAACAALLMPAAKAQGPVKGQDGEGVRLGTIRGRVVNDAGQPLANAAVYLRGTAPRRLARTATDEDGQFSVEVPADDAYNVRVSAPGYVASERAEIDDSPPANL